MKNNYYERTTDFEYPNEEPVEEDKTQELLMHLFFLLIEAKNPKVTLCAYCYVFGLDLGYLLQCENTISSISSRLGISKQRFHKVVNQIATKHAIPKERINGHKKTTDLYSISNYKNKAGTENDGRIGVDDR